MNGYFTELRIVPKHITDYNKQSPILFITLCGFVTEEWK